MARDPLEKETDVFNQMNQTIAFNNAQMKAAVASFKTVKPKAKPAAKKAAASVNVSKATFKKPGVGPAVNIAAKAAAVAPGVPRSVYDNKSSYQGKYKASAQAAPASPPNAPAKASTGSMTTVNTAYGKMTVQRSQVGQSAPAKPRPSGPVPGVSVNPKREMITVNTAYGPMQTTRGAVGQSRKNSGPAKPPKYKNSDITTVRTAYGDMKAPRGGTTQGTGKASDTLLALSTAIPGAGLLGLGVKIGRGVVAGVKVARAADPVIRAAQVSRKASGAAKAATKRETATIKSVKAGNMTQIEAIPDFRAGVNAREYAAIKKIRLEAAIKANKPVPVPKKQYVVEIQGKPYKTGGPAEKKSAQLRKMQTAKPAKRSR